MAETTVVGARVGEDIRLRLDALAKRWAESLGVTVTRTQVVTALLAEGIERSDLTDVELDAAVDYEIPRVRSPHRRQVRLVDGEPVLYAPQLVQMNKPGAPVEPARRVDCGGDGIRTRDNARQSVSLRLAAA